MEVRFIHINIVGMFSTKEEVKEIENLASVFYVEERVIYLTSGVETKINYRKKYLVQPSQKIVTQKAEYKQLQNFTVKGLN